MQVGSLVSKGFGFAFGIVIAISKDGQTVEVEWANVNYLTRLQYSRDLEVVCK
jgi:hypothetical protein